MSNHSNKDASDGDGVASLPTGEQLNLQTARIEWAELQRHFARGVVVIVGSDLDLIDIATAFVHDDRQRIEMLMKRERIRKPDLQDAAIWNERQSCFWAVVVAPWVLIQE